MAKILIVHGAGMNMRGKVQTEIFGKMTLPEYDEAIMKEFGGNTVSALPTSSVVRTISE